MRARVDFQISLQLAKSILCHFAYHKLACGS